MGFVFGRYLQCQSTDTSHYPAYSHSPVSSVFNSITFHYFSHMKKYFLMISFHLYHDSQDAPNSCIVRFCECLLLVYLSTPSIALKIFLVLLSTSLFQAKNCKLFNFSTHGSYSLPLKDSATLPSTFSCPSLLYLFQNGISKVPYRSKNTSVPIEMLEFIPSVYLLSLSHD